MSLYRLRNVILAGSIAGAASIPQVAIVSTRSALAELDEIELVRFVLFGEAAQAAFSAALRSA